MSAADTTTTHAPVDELKAEFDAEFDAEPVGLDDTTIVSLPSGCYAVQLCI